MKLKERARQLKSDIPVIFFALKQPDTPRMAKILATLTIAYALSPIDLVPDFIPVLGYLDDIILLPAMIAWTIKLIPLPLIARCREQILQEGNPFLKKRWYYSIPILLFWGLLLFLLIWAILF